MVFLIFVRTYIEQSGGKVCHPYYMGLDEFAIECLVHPVQWQPQATGNIIGQLPDNPALPEKYGVHIARSTANIARQKQARSSINSDLDHEAAFGSHLAHGVECAFNDVLGEFDRHHTTGKSPLAHSSLVAAQNSASAPAVIAARIRAIRSW